MYSEHGACNEYKFQVFLKFHFLYFKISFLKFQNNLFQHALENEYKKEHVISNTYLSVI